MRILRPAGLITLLLLSSCIGNVEIQNKPLAAGQANAKPSIANWPQNRPLIIISMSGGGARAAAMAYYVLKDLDHYPDGTGQRSLLDDVAVISSVSGGSVTAAQYGLFGKDGLPALYENFLLKDNMAALESELMNPWVEFSLWDGQMSRTDATRDLLDRHLFGRKTFADMQARGYPIVLLNATDMSSGQVFTFGPARFDDICSNLSGLPVAVGVAASSAFPILTTPVTLQDFNDSDAGCKGDVGPPIDIGFVKSDPTVAYENADLFDDDLYSNDLRNGPDARAQTKYLHLTDGGLADNLGVTALERAIGTPDVDIPLVYLISVYHPSKIVIITVRARGTVDRSLYAQKSTPGILEMAEAVAGVPIDADTNSLNQEFSDFSDNFQGALGNIARQTNSKAPVVYFVDFDPDELEGVNPGLAHDEEHISTSWTIKPNELVTMCNTVNALFATNPNFLALNAGLQAGNHQDIGQTPECP